MAKAICIRCGHAKSRPWKACRKCGFDPSDDEEALAKSVYLSAGRFEDAARQAAYERELDKVGMALSQGQSITYDKPELERLLEQKRTLERIPALAPWGAVARFFLPAVILLLVIAAIWLLLRVLR